MNEDNILICDETSAKYCKISTKWITNLFIDNIIQKLSRSRPLLLLDIGCGTGFITQKISSSLESKVICCDIDLKRVSFAKSYYQLETILADITYLPFKSSSFDMVIAIEVFEHLPNTDTALLEIRRVMVQNAIFTVPNEPFFMLANFLRGKNTFSYGNPQDHINHFNTKTFKSFLSKFFLSVKVSTNAFLWLIAMVEK